MDAAKQLRIISKAWGGQHGYCFFPYIPGHARTKEQRKAQFTQSEPFIWPQDRAKIIKHFEAHTDDDLYWYASLFDEPSPKKDNALDETALWADLDNADPNTFDQQYRPTIAWETSPGRYQALWLVSQGDIGGASDHGGLNQRLTRYLGADKAGWDTVQLLRPPGWKNHKPGYEEGTQGQLLWMNGPRYTDHDFDDLPEVNEGVYGNISDEVLEGELSRIDRHEVWGRVRLKVSKRVRDYLSVRDDEEVSGDRSDVLWQIGRDLADAGCSALEIIAVVRPTPWNKYAERQDELTRLTTEAMKVIAAKTPDKVDTASGLEGREEEEKPQVQSLATLLKDAKAPKWLVKDLWTEGACGFIGGEPKSYKSWFALDLALSVATGIPFLNTFTVRQPGPVLYIQEEDAPSLVKQRYNKIWPGKKSDKMETALDEDNNIVVIWMPAHEHDDDPQINAVIGGGFILSDEGWQSWLDEVLAQGWGPDHIPYRMVFMDPLMMIAGDVEENRAQEMTTKVFRPAKLLARKHNTALGIVHHVRKSKPENRSRGGQMLLGSVANHAWAESSLYISHRPGKSGDLEVERENKAAPSESFIVTGLRNRLWTPQVSRDENLIDDHAIESTNGNGNGNGNTSRGRGRPPQHNKLVKVIKEMGRTPTTAKNISQLLGITPDGAYKQLRRAETRGLVRKVGQQWQITP